MSDDDRPRIVALSPTVRPEERATTWTVTTDGSVYNASPSHPSLYGRAIGSPHLETVRDYLRLLGLVREDRSSFDRVEVVERWEPRFPPLDAPHSV